MREYIQEALKHLAEQFELPFMIHFVTPDFHALCGDERAMASTGNWTKVTCPECLRIGGQEVKQVEAKTPKPEATKESVKRQPAYKDSDTISFGKHRGELFSDVPASYLHWLWTQRPLRDQRLENYIFNNIEALRKEHPDGIWD